MSKTSTRKSSNNRKNNHVATQSKAVITKKPYFWLGLIALLAFIAAATVFGITVYAHRTEQRRLEATTRLHEMSNHDSGDTLEEVIATIQADMPKYEIIFVFDKDGQKLIEYSDKHPHDVGLPNEALKLLSRNFRDLTHVHNHPYCDNGHSDGDLHMLSRTGLDRSVDELVVIGEKHVYYMNHLKQKWPTMNDFLKYANTLYNEYGPFVEAGFMSLVVLEGQEYPYFTTNFLQKFADDFGYSFRVEATH